MRSFPLLKSVAYKMDTNTGVKPICSILHLSEKEIKKKYPGSNNMLKKRYSCKHRRSTK